jgi:ribonuclease Y
VSTIITIHQLVILVLCSIVFLFFGYFWRKQLGVKSLHSAEKRAKDIVQEAEKVVLAKQREADIEAKEILYRMRNEFERESRKKRKEIQFQEKRIQQRELNIERKLEVLDKKESEISVKEKSIDGRYDDLKNKETEYINLIEEVKRKLSQVAGMPQEEAKNQLLKIMEDESKKEFEIIYKKLEEETLQQADDRATEIILSAMQRLAADEVSENVVSVISLPNEEIKGRIIGREGRNIKAFEKATGVDLIVDDTPEAVTLSSFSLYRREIARLTLEKLIADGRIHPGRIEEIVAKIQEKLDEEIISEGKNALFEVGIENVHPELVKLVGKLKYRTSFGQNALQHTKESAYFAGMIAADLGLDVKLAKRAALLHDIGKAIDQEVEGSHPEIGAELLRKYDEPEVVVNAALFHHKDMDINSPYTVLSQVADTISATRPGARRDTLEKYIRRIEDLEKIAYSFKGVEDAFAVSAGREIRVIVKPDKISDEEAKNLVRDIAKNIENSMEYIGQVKVTVIRETREIEFAK